jgi:hypothetical protein
MFAPGGLLSGNPGQNSDQLPIGEDELPLMGAAVDEDLKGLEGDLTHDLSDGPVIDPRSGG